MADLSAIKAELALDWARIGPFATCELLALKYFKESRAAMICCPWHADRTPSCSVTIGPEATIRAHCFSCDTTWDAHALYAQVHGLNLQGSAFKELLVREAETLSRWDLVEALEGKRSEPRPATPTPPRTEPQPEPERPLPDLNEVRDFVGSCVNVTEDETVALYLRSRHIDPQAVSVRGLAYALPDNVKHLPEWARYKGSTWAELGHWLIIPVYNHLGSMVSVRSGRVIDGDSPKRLPPAGCRVRGTIMADAMGQEMLKLGAWPDWATTKPGVVILEGEPDWLTVAVKTPLLTCPDKAVLGIYSGSWCDQIAKRIPDGAKVAIWTDQDAAGDKYAHTIGASLHKRCTVVRGK
jgi:DNA primase